MMKRSAIILIAGMGTRLKPYTESAHKCLTRINGIPILQNTLDILENNGINEVILVVGYMKEQIVEFVSKRQMNMNIKYASNDHYDDTSTSHSLLLGLHKLDNYDELYVLEGDVFFSEEVMGLLVDGDENATVLEPYNEKLSGTFISMRDDGTVTEWTRESRRPKGYTLTDKFKTVNLYKFSRNYVDEALLPATAEIDKLFEGKESMESVMNEAEKCKRIKGIVLDGEKWYEIDDANDLMEAEKVFASGESNNTR